MKRSLALLLTLALLLLLTPYSVLADATSDNQAVNEVNLAKQAGLVTDKVTRDYQKNISREEFCELVVKLYEKLTGKTATAGADIFTDTDNADILKAYSLGIIKGISADKFAPGNYITRQEICVMLARCIDTAISDADITSYKNNIFADGEKIASWAGPSVNYAYDKSVIKVVGSNRIDPLGNVTCEQAILLAYKIYNSQADFSSVKLKAGAGSAEIVFPDELFPLEGFNKVHDNPYARVLVLESDIKVAIVSIELVNIPADGIEICKKIVSEKTGTPVENIWVHATHAITTPHAPSDEAIANTSWLEYISATHTAEDTPKSGMFIEAIANAITEAAQEADDSFQTAVAGFGTGNSYVNANRDIQLPDGSWTIGLNGEGPSNPLMQILRVDSLSGDPIGFLISYGIKPSAIDNSEMKAGTRQVSSDVPGLACRLVEEEFGAPALFCMSSAGDQIPKETALYNVIGANGKATQVDLGVEKGLEIVERLGTQMAKDAIGIAGKISCTQTAPKTAHIASSFKWSGIKEGDGELEVTVEAIRFGDAAFVAFKPETNCITELQLQGESPFKYTMLMSFVNGDFKYMPDAEAYDKGTFETTRTGLAKGAAEQFVKTALELLGNLMK